MKKLSFKEIAEELAKSEFLRTQPAKKLSALFERDEASIRNILKGVEAVVKLQKTN